MELLENEKEAFALAKEYKKFIDENKTEREIVRTVESMAKKWVCEFKRCNPNHKKFMQLITKKYFTSGFKWREFKTRSKNYRITH